MKIALALVAAGLLVSCADDTEQWIWKSSAVCDGTHMMAEDWYCYTAGQSAADVRVDCLNRVGEVWGSCASLDCQVSYVEGPCVCSDAGYTLDEGC